MHKYNQNDANHYYDGAWKPGHGHTFHSINPANGEVIWEGRHATPEEVNAAVLSAHQALPAWSLLDFSTRVNYLLSFAKAIEAERETLAELIALETGKPLWEALTEVSAVVGKIKLSIEAYQARTFTKKIEATDANAYVRYKPHGVIAVIGPFNFPAHLSHGHIVPALLAGNTVVYKPSELTPAVAEWILCRWHDTGLPSGVLNGIQGDVSSAQSLLRQDIQGVYFTGSYQTGLSIHQQFTNRPDIILALEMGGNNPVVIDDVSDMKAAVYHTLISSFITAGQRCSCARRLMIPDSEAGDAFLKRFTALSQTLHIGPYTDKPEPFIGPVIHHQHALAHLDAQKQLKALGGDLLLPMTLMMEDTGFLTPGIIDMTKVERPPDEEIFAPFVQIYRYHDFEEALALANQTRYGLAASIFTKHASRYEQFYQTIRSGLIHWNKPTIGAASNMPFGGIGRSGNHRPSAYYAADYCAYPIASLEQSNLSMPAEPLPGIYEHAKL